jgi:hypothetical protein
LREERSEPLEVRSELGFSRLELRDGEMDEMP